MNYENVYNGSFDVTASPKQTHEACFGEVATFSKMEMQLSPFLLCNFRYFYYAINKNPGYISWAKNNINSEPVASLLKKM